MVGFNAPMIRTSIDVETAGRLGCSRSVMITVTSLVVLMDDTDRPTTTLKGPSASLEDKEVMLIMHRGSAKRSFVASDNSVKLTLRKELSE